MIYKSTLLRTNLTPTFGTQKLNQKQERTFSIKVAKESNFCYNLKTESSKIIFPNVNFVIKNFCYSVNFVIKNFCYNLKTESSKISRTLLEFQFWGRLYNACLITKTFNLLATESEQ